VITILSWKIIKLFIAELNEKQRRAVLDENKRVLVLAGAGSGKTKTLIQKVMYLIAEKQVSPKHILAITFTRNAANEMMDRLILMADTDGKYKQIISNKKLTRKEKNKKRREYIKKYAWLNSITVKTFHSLCNQILRARVSVDFDNKYKILMDNTFDADQSSRQIARETPEEIIHKLVVSESSNPDYLLSLKRYILNYYIDVYTLKLHEKHPDIYQKPFTTLGGEHVRSKSERDIADWLYRHRIDYVYEPIIAPETFEMQPDFFIPEANLYLEHVSNLSYSLKDKQRVMKEAGENYYKIHEEVMRDTSLFNKKMDELVLSRIDKDFSHVTPLEFSEEFTGVEKYLRYFVLDTLKMIDKIKVHNKHFSNIFDKAQDSKHQRIRLFYQLAKPLFYGYQKYCVNHSYLDFNDLIIQTVSLLKRYKKIRQRYQNKFKFILVDEFQDVNTLQVELLKYMIHEKNQLFCVGDDWQSIYGFRGANVEYIVNFKEHFTNPTITKLNMNYRSNTTIVNASNEIIKHNKFKIDKEIQSYQEHGKKIYLYSARKEENDGIATVIKNCKKLLESGYQPEDILVLTRTRKSDAFKEYFKNLKKLKIRITTIHQAKGLEAKIVFIIGLVDGFYGFPNIRDDDQIFQLIKKSDYALNLEEERRLFYVALTRAKEELFLISELGRESDFITEIPGQFLDRKNFLILNIEKQHEKRTCPNCQRLISFNDNIKYCPYCGIRFNDQKNESKLKKNKKESKQELDKEIQERVLYNNKDFFEELKRWRSKTAKSLEIPTYCILHNRSLYEIIKRKPKSKKELEKIYGIGKQKVEKYGSEILEIVKLFSDKKSETAEKTLIKNNSSKPKDKSNQLGIVENNKRNKGLIILQCLNEMKSSTGRTLLTETLHGKSPNHPKVQDTKIYLNSFFGEFKNYSFARILKLIDHLILEGYIEQYESSYGNPLIRLTNKGKKAILEKEHITLKIKRKRDAINPLLILAMRGNKNHIPKLIESIKSGNEENRRLAAYALGRLSHLKPEIFTATPHLIRLLDDENKKIKLACIKSLGQIGDEKALPYLILLRREEKDEDILFNINQSIKEIGNKDFDNNQNISESKHPEIKKHERYLPFLNNRDFKKWNEFIYYIRDYFPTKRISSQIQQIEHDKIIRIKRDKRYALETQYELLIRNFKKDADITLCVIPSHNKGLQETSMRYLAKKLSKKNITNGTSCLLRAKTIPEKHLTNNRDINQEKSSLKVQYPSLIKNKIIVVLDDIVTTGTSMLAAKELLEEAGAKRVYGLAIAKTVYEDEK